MNDDTPTETKGGKDSDTLVIEAEINLNAKSGPSIKFGFDGDDVLRYLAVDATETELHQAKTIVNYSLKRLAKQQNKKTVDRILNC